MTGKRAITHIPTFFGMFNVLFFSFYLLMIVAVFAFSQIMQDILAPETLLLLVAIAALVPPVLVYVQRQGLKVRTQALQTYAQAHSYEFYPDTLLASDDIVFGSIAKIHNARNPHAIDAVKGDGWLYYDFTYDIYQRTKYGDYKADRIYYGIMGTTLPRQLPHIFFDSFKSRKQQFRFEFARSQRYSFEGDFNQSFVAYMPDAYKIDTLSFISPEVMVALQAADDYDIEIIGNKVLLLGPLGDPATQLPDMAAKLAAIKKELVDNIDTYRDERLPYKDGRTMVAQAGTQLRSSSVYFWISVAGVAVGILVIFFRIVASIVQVFTGPQY